MATTAIWKVSDSLQRVINYALDSKKTLDENTGNWDLNRVLEYVEDSEKTKSQHFVSAINCSLNFACKEMLSVKKQFQKEEGILAFHGYQSFKPNEVTAQQAHEIGVKLAKELWSDRFQVIVTTHLNKDHIHNHFVINSVSFVDGKRYYDNKATYKKMREVSDRLCQEKALSVILNPKRKGKHYAEWKAEQEHQPTWRSMIAADVDSAISQSRTFTQFIKVLKVQGYEVKTGVKYIAIRPPNKERFVRLKTLGQNYTEDKIKERLLFTGTSGVPVPIPRFHWKNHRPKARIKGIRGLYFHYLYQFGILPKKKSNRQIPFSFRKDITKLNRIIEEAKLLQRLRISTMEELNYYRATVINDLQKFRSRRKEIYKKSKSTRTVDLENELNYLSQEIRKLRKEVEMCDDIALRSGDIGTMIRVENEEKEREKNEQQRSRRSRSGRIHES